MECNFTNTNINDEFEERIFPTLCILVNLENTGLCLNI